MSRDTIFARIRAGLGAGVATDEARRAAVAQRLAGHAANLVPERATTPPPDPLDVLQLAILTSWNAATLPRLR